MTTVTIRHARDLGYCAKGMREWFNDKGLSYIEFVEHGFDASVFDPYIDDIMIKALVDYAIAETGK